MDIREKPPYMFPSPIVDYFFRWRWWAAWVVFVPIIATLLALAIVTATSLWQVVGSFCGGLFFWTLFEYFMHRFAFHFEGKSTALQHMHYVVHGMHHAYPTDPTRVIFPPFSSIGVGILIAGLFFLALPLTWALGVLAGFVLGYVFYEYIHYAVHQLKGKQAWFFKRKRHHLLHHHNEEYRDKNFGVTTELWDRVFNTFKL